MIIQITPEETLYQLEHIKDDRRTEMRVAFTSNIILAMVAVLLRLVARRIVRAKLQADDYTIMAALLVTLGEYGVSMYGLHIGCGRHLIMLGTPAAGARYAKVVLSCQCCYLGATWIVKTSILLLYRRLFGCKRWFNRLIWLMIGFIAVNQILQLFLSVFSCRPVNALWNMTLRGDCININLAALIFGSLNVVIDLILLIMPIPLVWRLRIEMRWRLQLVAIFLLGSFVCLGSVYRVITIRKFATTDQTWNDVDPAIWAITENSMGIVSACLTTMRPLFTIFARGHRCTMSTDGTCKQCFRNMSRNHLRETKITTTGNASMDPGLTCQGPGMRGPLFRTPVWSPLRSHPQSSRPNSNYQTQQRRGSVTKLRETTTSEVRGTQDSGRTLVEENAPQTPPKDVGDEFRVISADLGGGDGASIKTETFNGPYMEIF